MSTENFTQVFEDRLFVYELSDIADKIRNLCVGEDRAHFLSTLRISSMRKMMEK